jgi:hypothetical protein
MTFRPAKGGYVVSLSRGAANDLTAVLDRYASDKDIVQFVIENALKRGVDPDTKLFVAVVAADVLLFKHSLKRNMGRRGVTIRVIGPSLLGETNDWVEALIPPVAVTTRWCANIRNEAVAAGCRWYLSHLPASNSNESPKTGLMGLVDGPPLELQLFMRLMVKDPQARQNIEAGARLPIFWRIDARE